MKTLNILVITFILNILFLNPIFLFAQDSSSKKVPAPIKIIDFEGCGGEFGEIDFAGQDSIETKVKFRTQLNKTDSRFILQGQYSRYIHWDFQQGQYAGWGISMLRGGRGFDVTKFKLLRFGVIGNSGSERFRIEVKDVRNNQSSKYFKAENTWKTVKIPLNSFDNRVDFNQLETITLVFDRTNSGPTGAIYIDDFELAQMENEKVAPLKLIDFDGGGNFSDFAFSGPLLKIIEKRRNVDYELSYNESDQKVKKQGETSRYLRWNLMIDQYCGWAVILGDSAKPFNASQVNTLTFWVLGAKGNEIFDIEIKDINNATKLYNVTALSTWTKICIPFDHNKLDTNIDLVQLKSIALVFKGKNCDKGAIYFDDFQFEFRNCN